MTQTGRQSSPAGPRLSFLKINAKWEAVSKASVAQLASAFGC